MEVGSCGMALRFYHEGCEFIDAGVHVSALLESTPPLVMRSPRDARGRRIMALHIQTKAAQ